MKDETIIKADVTQIKDGREYQGNISFDNLSFQYNLKFGVPINKLDELLNRSPKDLMSQIYLNVTDAKGKVVPLNDNSKALFMATAGRLAIEFYNNPQTRDANEGFLGKVMRQEVPEFIGATCGMSTEYRWPRIPELERFLEAYRK